jgi:hypothetical protein
MESFAHRAASRAQAKYGINPNPTRSVPQEGSDFDAHDIPLSAKASTMGSVAQRTAWRTPAGAAYSAQSRKSTLFDEDASSVARISRDQ